MRVLSKSNLQRYRLRGAAAVKLEFILALLLVACTADPPAPSQECYPLDGNGDWPVNPTDFVQNYCGRGPTNVDGRGVVDVCVPEPAGGCDPCLWDAAEADARLRDAMTSLFETAGCPADYQPEQFIRGCFAANPGAGECCYTAEYITDESVCDPVPDEAP